MDTKKTLVIAVTATALVFAAMLIYTQRRQKQREEELRLQYEASLLQAQRNSTLQASPVATLVASVLGGVF